jgi:hypothetical protein
MLPAAHGAHVGNASSFHAQRLDWSDRCPRISKAAAAPRTASATIDGEAVWCDGQGLAIFDKPHSRAHDAEVILYALDLGASRVLCCAAGGTRLLPPTGRLS